MRSALLHRLGLTGLAVSAALLAGCGDDTDTGPVVGSDRGTLTLACPTAVTAGVKTVNGFTASLLQANGTPVGGAFIGLAATPGQGEVYAPPESASATAGGTTNAQGRLAFGYAAPASAANNASVLLTARSGAQTATCRVTVQTASLTFAAPANGSVQNVCSPVRLTVASAAGSDASVRVAGTVDVAASNGGLLTSSATACAGAESLSGVPISGTTGDFQTPLYVVARSATTTTVTLTDTANAARGASLELSFVDQPTAISLDTSTLQVNPSPSSARFASLTATVTNASGRAVANQPVDFAVEKPVGGTNADRVNPAVATTNVNGIASARYEAGTNTGNATVRVCVQKTQICDRRTLAVTTGTAPPPSAPPPASRLVLDASPLKISPSPADARFSTLTATLYDSTNALVANQTVVFTVETPLGGTNPDRLSPASGVTGSAGTATSRYEAGTNTGNATILACAQNTNVCDRRTIAVSGTSPSSTPARVALNADPGTVTAAPATARYAALKAMVYDAANNAIPGQTVNFTVETHAGGGSADRVDPASSPTDANGAATARYEAGTTPGNATVAACVQGTSVCGRQTIAVASAGAPGAATQLAAKADKDTVFSRPSNDRFATITATATDASNQPVPNQAVTFELQNSTGGSPADSLGTTDAVTDASGAATTRYEAGQNGGTRAEIKACLKNTQTCTVVVVTTTRLQAKTITLSPATAQAATNKTGTLTLTATVIDNSNNPLPGQEVVFQFDAKAADGDSVTPAKASTGDDGTVQTEFRPGDGNGGTAQVRACAYTYGQLCSNVAVITVTKS